MSVVHTNGSVRIKRVIFSFREILYINCSLYAGVRRAGFYCRTKTLSINRGGVFNILQPNLLVSALSMPLAV